MNQRKKILLFPAILLLIVFFLLFYQHQNRFEAKVVQRVPSGFIQIDELTENFEGDRQYVFWESQVAILDTSGECVYQTSVKNDHFIVKYKGDYYINQDMLM
ncbi:hypothetical protein [Flavonifractor hominis]|uniref:DUF3139 domain-containing protein n=1 Tax=Flavonifractor hominis TaxID=3133178 RepID=A0ABV1EKM9_9FIRM